MRRRSPMHPLRFVSGRSPNSGQIFGERIFLCIERKSSRYCRTGDKTMASVPEIITSNIIEQLERGVAPWRKPWSTSIPRNLISKKPYRGLNVFLLATQGYGSPYWLTFNQAKQLGAHVRQGEKSSIVSFWKFNEYARENRETGETENKTSVLLRYYR